VAASSAGTGHSGRALVPAVLVITGICIRLGAEFVAGMQVLIYAGAITVLLLFVIMLTEGGTGLRLQQRNEQGPVGASVAVAIAVLLIAGVTHTTWGRGAGTLPAYTPGAIGQSFLGTNLLAFEGTSIVLLVSLIGA